MSTQTQAETAPSGGVKGVWAGFRDFLMRGNVVELAVAVVVGTAFSKIVDSVVKGLINPLVGAIGTEDLENYESCLKAPCKVDDSTGEIIRGVPIKWGPVLSASLTFIFTAAVVYFLMILPMSKYKARRAAKNPPPPAGATEVELLTEIRDLLVVQRDGSADANGLVKTADAVGGTGDAESGTGGTAGAEGSVGTQRGSISTEK